MISRGRAGRTITQKVLPKWVTFVVPESQEQQYRAHLSNPIMTCPDDTLGLGKTRNFVLDHVKTRMVAIFDDDIKCVRYIGGAQSRPLTPEEVVFVVCNMAQMTDDAGLHTFCFAQRNRMTFDPHLPFALKGTCSGFIGIIDRKYRFMENKLKVDVDYILQNLLYDRVVFFEGRYALELYIDSNSGGSSLFRSEDKIKEERAILCKKWGKYLQYKETRALKHQQSRMIVVPSINVKRTQSLDI